MVRIAAILIAVSLAGCSDLGGFEHDLMGSDAAAWKLCKDAFHGKVYSAPPYGEKTESYILFSWKRDVAEHEGGPLFCKTNGDGTKLIDFQMSKKNG